MVSHMDGTPCLVLSRATPERCKHASSTVMFLLFETTLQIGQRAGEKGHVCGLFAIPPPAVIML
jgi:hypothetical protein